MTAKIDSDQAADHGETRGQDGEWACLVAPSGPAVVRTPSGLGSNWKPGIAASELTRTAFSDIHVHGPVPG